MNSNKFPAPGNSDENPDQLEQMKFKDTEIARWEDGGGAIYPTNVGE